MYVNNKLGLKRVGAGAADDLSAAAVHSESYVAMSRVRVRQLVAIVSTLTDSGGTDAVVTFKRRPTFGSAAGEVDLGTITFPDASAVGTVLLNKITPVVLEVGDQLVYEVTTAAGTAGGAVYDVLVDESPEDYRNEDNVTLVTA